MNQITMTKEQIENRYIVLPHGLVYSQRSGRHLTGKIDRYGYRVLCLSLDCGVKHIPLHRIVALCYIPNPDNKPQINHIDGNKLNNRVNNLEWCDAQYNTQHAYDNGLAKAWNKDKPNCYSKEHVDAMKANQPNKKNVEVIQGGVTVAKYDSVRELCQQMGFDRRTAMRVLKGESNYNSIKGYKLIYS